MFETPKHDINSVGKAIVQEIILFYRLISLEEEKVEEGEPADENTSLHNLYTGAQTDTSNKGILKGITKIQINKERHSFRG